MGVSSTGVARGAALYLRLALASAFLSAVADRFGVWGLPGEPGVAWGDFDRFLAYAAFLVPFLPRAGVPVLGWVVTIAEVALAAALLIGFRVREAAAASAVLLLGFALGMVIGDGVKSPLDASVLTASAGALLLYVHPHSYWSVDAALALRRTGQGADASATVGASGSRQRASAATAGERREG